MEFELNEAAVTMLGKAESVEEKGGEHVLMCDLTFAYTAPNTTLAMFSPTLRWSFYDRQGEQGELPLSEDHLPALRYSQIESVKWKAPKLEGATLCFHEIKKGKNLEFENATAHKWRIDFQNGGTVTISFQVRVRPEGQEPGILSELFKAGGCVISLYVPGGREAGEE